MDAGAAMNAGLVYSECTGLSEVTVCIKVETHDVSLLEGTGAANVDDVPVLSPWECSGVCCCSEPGSVGYLDAIVCDSASDGGCLCPISASFGVVVVADSLSLGCYNAVNVSVVVVVGYVSGSVADLTAVGSELMLGAVGCSDWTVAVGGASHDDSHNVNLVLAKVGTDISASELGWYRSASGDTCESGLIECVSYVEAGVHVCACGAEWSPVIGSSVEVVADVPGVGVIVPLDCVVSVVVSVVGTGLGTCASAKGLCGLVTDDAAIWASVVYGTVYAGGKLYVARVGWFFGIVSWCVECALAYYALYDCCCVYCVGVGFAVGFAVDWLVSGVEGWVVDLG